MTNKIVAVGAFLAVLGFGAQLNALDTFTPGLMCRYYDPLGDDTFFDPGGLSANGLKNTSGSSQLVSCPITKSNGAKPVIVEMFINDDNPDCKLYSRHADGSTSNTGPTNIYSLPNGMYQHVWFIAAGWTPGQWASVAIYCRIDAGKSIINYRYAE